MSSSSKDHLSVAKTESISSSNKSLDSNHSDDSFKSSRTSTSNQNLVNNQHDSENMENSVITNATSSLVINRETSDSPKDQSAITKDSNKNTSKDVSNDQLNDTSIINANDFSPTIDLVVTEASKNSENDSSKIEQIDSTPSSSSIDIERLISNLEISDENNELTNSLINLINKRSSLHESVENKSKSSQSKKPSLVSLDIDGVVDYIKEKKCSKIIVMTGAGVSTSAGIPDFRSPNSGFFAKLKKYKIPSPECIFEINYFKKDPKPFFELGTEIFASKLYKPTPTHHFIKLLDDKGLLLRLYSQNIDGLEADVGLSDEKVVYAHGSFNKSHCLACNHEYDFEFMKNFMSLERKEVVVPRCEKCNRKPMNIIKPDIVFYGQRLPSIFFERSSVDFLECDLLLVMGTSLVVQPFAGLVNNVKENVPRVLINRERTGEFLRQERYLSLRNGASERCNERDIFLKGDSDKTIMELAEKLGWRDDLEKSIQSK